MGFMVEHHLPTLRSADRKIRDLRTDSNEEQINKMLSWIHRAIDSIETKLRDEEYLYA